MDWSKRNTAQADSGSTVRETVRTQKSHCKEEKRKEELNKWDI
jgi:hypothetical protein